MFSARVAVTAVPGAGASSSLPTVTATAIGVVVVPSVAAMLKA
jgi:hypothetical protein